MATDKQLGRLRITLIKGLRGKKDDHRATVALDDDIDEIGKPFGIARRRRRLGDDAERGRRVEKAGQQINPLGKIG